MEEFEKIMCALQKRGFEPEIITETYNESSWKIISWVNSDGYKWEIFENNWDFSENKIAWFQRNEKDSDHRLVIYEDENYFEWEPVTYNSFFGCTCFLLEWYREYLIFIYQEKHDVYICSVKDKTVKHFNFHGELIAKKENLVSFKTFMDHSSDKVWLLKIPEMEELGAVSIEEANEMDLVPHGVSDLKRTQRKE